MFHQALPRLCAIYHDNKLPGDASFLLIALWILQLTNFNNFNMSHRFLLPWKIASKRDGA